MTKRKFLTLLWSFILAIFFFIPVSKIYADEGWTIDSFQSDITVEKTGVVKINETLSVNFNNLLKHGIFRDIPYIYETDGNKTYTDISVTRVTQNNNAAHYQVSNEESYTRIKIGDANKTISGKNTYQIEYIAKGVLRNFPEHDELYWNVTGNYWPVSLLNAQTTVTLPDDIFIKSTC